ncbi:hypothetical protein AtubIFM55763_006853 [Aspergillus tubingensis]|uniref:Anaphase-promoting complex subunit 11 RING-H2 finger domain-containing protein n=2 Tax=Aspergillus subgen. Circumdati TaxID=2720871 RepID=A0A9W6ENQ3_ASPTU|nr:similar to An15g01970 [Aspergillus niger]GLA75573.1 hypothetical protein AtubIFM55763_006853 [Aspergillus tubingensis]GLA86578.1 hypothetical protein AtubIFM56815_010847 [Aspergillus tubingensis]GLA93486.1 hypothetical protein AtubIFM57143_011082 [Aspergillus tubingensis]
MASASRYQLADILKINPAADHHCVGVSHSYNRRCNNLISYQKRDEAYTLIERGTHIFTATSSISAVNPILSELASLLLCPNQHRYQYLTLVEQWEAKLQRYLAERSAESTTAMSNSYLHMPPNPTIMATGSGLAVTNLTTSHHGPSSSSRITIQHGMVGMGANHHHPQNSRPRVEIVRPAGDSVATTMSASASGSASPLPHANSAFHHRPHTPAVQLVSSTLIASGHTHPAHQTAPRPIPSGESTVSMYCDSPTSPKPQRVKPRPVDGDCGICLLPYLDESMRCDMSDDEGTEDDEDDDWEEMDDEELAGPDYDHSLLVWCRGFCGTNYHRACLEQWLDTFDTLEPTCPTCRNYWIH